MDDTRLPRAIAWGLAGAVIGAVLLSNGSIALSGNTEGAFAASALGLLLGIPAAVVGGRRRG